MLERCTVILVRPMFGGNVGASARALKNTGLGELRLVDPTYEDDDEALKFSHGAEEILASARRFDDLSQALEGHQQIVGFTVRERHRRAIVSLREFASGWMRAAMMDPEPPRTALLFGPERDGLKNVEMDRCTDLVWIPSHPDHPSYNLAQAVLLCAYELFCAQLAVDPAAPRAQPRQTRRPPASPPADAGDLEQLADHLREGFLEIGYAYPHTVTAMLRAYHEIFSRARLVRREAVMLRGLAQQMIWAGQRIKELERPE